MRSRWCTNLAKKDWGRITRTRIGLRRQLGRDPTFEEVDTALKTNQKYLNINADDIAKAFNDGAEVRRCLEFPLRWCSSSPASATRRLDNEMRRL